MALIDKETIRAEIERRKKELPEQNAHTTVGADSIRMAARYDDLLAFLDTLPEQPVTDCYELDSEIFFWQKAHANEDTAQVIAMTARHFAEWGKNNLK